MRSIVENLLVGETLRHMPPEGGSGAGAYSNVHLERLAIRHLFGDQGLAFADAAVRVARARRLARH
jgi:hypothetical protein